MARGRVTGRHELSISIFGLDDEATAHPDSSRPPEHGSGGLLAGDLSGSVPRLRAATSLALDFVHVQFDEFAALTLDEGLTERSDSPLMLFQEAQTCADNLAGGAVAPACDLAADELLEVISEDNACVLGHGVTTSYEYHYILSIGIT